MQASRGIFRIPTPSKFLRTQISPPQLHLHPRQLAGSRRQFSHPSHSHQLSYNQPQERQTHLLKLHFLLGLDRTAQPELTKEAFRFHWLELYNPAAKLLPPILYSQSFPSIITKFTDTLWSDRPVVGFPPLQSRAYFRK